MLFSRAPGSRQGIGLTGDIYKADMSEDNYTYQSTSSSTDSSLAWRDLSSMKRMEHAILLVT